jgi:hypothetical protein
MDMSAAKRVQELWSEYIVAGSAKPGDENWLKTEQFLRQHADSIAKLREAASRRELGLNQANSGRYFCRAHKKLENPRRFGAFNG